MNLKNYREKELNYYVMGNLLVFMALGTFDGVAILNTRITATMQMIPETVTGLLDVAVLMGIIYIYVFILDSITSSDFKHAIIFLGKRNMPGNLVFSAIKSGKYKDMRFDRKAVLEKYKDVYQKIEENKSTFLENEKWYELLRRNNQDSMISTSHRDFLMCRDMCMETLWLLAFYLTVRMAFSQKCPQWTVMLWLIVEFVVMNIATRMKSKRFVLNVIAADLHENGDE